MKRKPRPVVMTTLATQGYLPMARRCTESLAAHHGEAQAYLGAVGCDGEAALVEGVESYLVPAGMLHRSLGNPGNGCIQHGNFLPYLPGADDVVICLDGDVRMQRGFTLDEWAELQAWPEGAVGIGPNASPTDTLNDEALRIQPLLSLDELAQRFYPDPATPPLCGNAGVLVATRRTWWRLWMAYLRRFLDTAPCFAHIAVQQWTINLVIEESFTRVVLPQSFHTHGHYGKPEQADGWGWDGVATWDGEPVLFAHRTW